MTTEGDIGLERGRVEVVAYRPGWRAFFAEERQRLLAAIGPYVAGIEHVGSTAVPGLPAKPIVDIAVAVSGPAAIDACRGPLLALGYIDRGDLGDLGDDGGYLFVKESAPAVRTVHLHIVAVDDSQWRNYLRFRDVLRADEGLRDRYAALKRSLQARFAGDRQGYLDAKHAFIRGVLHER